MKNLNRKPDRLFASITNFLACYPDVRVGQLLDCVRLQSFGQQPDIFYIENDDLAEAIDKYLADLFLERANRPSR